MATSGADSARNQEAVIGVRDFSLDADDIFRVAAQDAAGAQLSHVDRPWHNVSLKSFSQPRKEPACAMQVPARP